MTKEVVITINRTTLTDAQSMTIRAALECYAHSLANEGLGYDETGRSLAAFYLDRITEIRAALYKQTTPDEHDT